MDHAAMLRCSESYRAMTLGGADEADLAAYRRDYDRGADLERQRLAAILRTGARMGQAHYELAKSLAFGTDLPPEAAISVLRAAPAPAEPAATAARAHTDFAAHLAHVRASLARSDQAERARDIEDADDALGYLRRIRAEGGGEE